MGCSVAGCADVIAGLCVGLCVGLYADSVAGSVVVVVAAQRDEDTRCVQDRHSVRLHVAWMLR